MQQAKEQYGSLAKQHLANDDCYNAVKTLLLAIEQHPDEHLYKLQLAATLNNRVMGAYAPLAEEAALTCLRDDIIDHHAVNLWWHSLLFYKPGYQIFRSIATYQDFTNNAEALIAAMDECFILGLKRLLIRDSGPGGIVLHLRRYMLEHYNERHWPLLCSMAHLCFHNEYIFSESPAETSAVEKLRATLEAGESDAATLLLYSCYRPLIGLENIAALRKFADKPDQNFQNIMYQQIDEPLEEAGIKTQIKKLGTLSNPVTQKVRAQYEEFPYPRWRSFAAPKAHNSTVKKILIAGCGTGLQVARARANHPQADITAIDISTTSLAYALRQCKALGLDNIQFYQADILELKELDKTFDLIHCTGVLHHMAEPLQGWRALTDLLEPHGRMKIGLYSAIARQHVTAIRDFIAQKGYTADLEGMRACRAALQNLPADDPKRAILNSTDFYSTSACRDAIFHVQEHLFTIPKIEESLAVLNLGFEFFAFSHDTHIKKYRQMFSDDAPLTNLKNWHLYEQENPRSFAGMYQFFCRKPA